MKTKSSNTARCLTAMLLVCLLAVISFAREPIPVSSSLRISPDGAGNLVNVTVSDPYNFVWTLQSSSNLTDWAEVEALKVHNGSFARQFAPDAASPVLFFRAVYDAARQDILSTMENALRLPATAFNYAAPNLPPSFFVQPILSQDNMPATNVTTDAGATLGRVLFYDKRLSTNQTIACASCHQQARGFSDGRRFSVGFNGGQTGRNSMGLSNARWYQRRHFFWDERANTLEDQVLQPIQNPVEMGMTLPSLVNRLGTEPFYTNLFARAFGTPE